MIVYVFLFLFHTPLSSGTEMIFKSVIVLCALRKVKFIILSFKCVTYSLIVCDQLLRQ